MDYWKQRRAYRSLKLVKLHTSAGQNNLYRELLDYANDEGYLDEWFEIKNEALASLTGLSDRGMKEARNGLVQSGLIEYKQGKRSAANPQYRITRLYRTQSASSHAPKSASVSTEKVPQGVPQVVPQGVPPSTYTKTDYDQTINTKSSRQKSAKRTYAEDSEPYKAAAHLWARVKDNNPETKPPNLQAWSDDMRKMHELDKRPWEKINKMVDWSQDDAFWSGNILSADKLRKQYDKMAAKANADAKQAAQPKRNGRQSRKEDTPDWLTNPRAVEVEELTPERQKIIAEKMAKLEAFKKGDDT